MSDLWIVVTPGLFGLFIKRARPMASVVIYGSLRCTAALLMMKLAPAASVYLWLSLVLNFSPGLSGTQHLPPTPLHQREVFVGQFRVNIGGGGVRMFFFCSVHLVCYKSATARGSSCCCRRVISRLIKMILSIDYNANAYVWHYRWLRSSSATTVQIIWVVYLAYGFLKCGWLITG